jgi:hypothetical protein
MRRRSALSAVAIALGLSGAAAQVPPNAADLLFEHPQWAAAAPGTTLAYRYTRTSPLESVFGANIDDHIRLSLDPGVAQTTRTVRVDMFSQDRHRAAGPFEEVSGNPVLVLFLQHHLENIASVLKANPRYVKNAIRAGLRDKAATTPTTIEVDGRSADGWRVETRPFVDDPNRAKMRGLESLTYTFVTSDAVPGAIASVAVTATAADGNQILSETLTYDPKAP